MSGIGFHSSGLKIRLPCKFHVEKRTLTWKKRGLKTSIGVEEKHTSLSP